MNRSCFAVISRFSGNGFAPNVIRFAGARFDEVPSRIREHVASPPWPAQHEATRVNSDEDYNIYHLNNYFSLKIVNNVK
jgi:hypothetical protein